MTDHNLVSTWQSRFKANIVAEVAFCLQICTSENSEEIWSRGDTRGPTPMTLSHFNVGK